MGPFSTPALSRRTFLQGATAGGAALLLPSLARSQPRRGGRMVLGSRHGSTTDTTEPGMLLNSFQVYVAYAYSSTLTELLPDGALGPALATSWDSSDAVAWQFKLRGDVTFHDGRALTVEDVIASLNFHRRPDSVSSVKPTAEQIESIVADGKDGILVRLKAANADLPASFNDPSFTIFPASGETIDWQSRNGTGAYMLEAFEPGSRALLRRNPNYWRDDRGFADEVELLSIADATSRTSALVSGQVDAIDAVDLKTVNLLRSQSGVVIEEASGPIHYTFPMLTNVAPFNDPDVRQALKFAIDRQEIVDKVLSGYGSIGNDHPIGPTYRYHASDIDRNVYDPDRARFHLTRANVAGLAVDLHAADAAFAGAVDAAVLYSEQAKKAGIAINVIREANDAYWDNVWMKKAFCACYWAGAPVESQMFALGYARDAGWNDTRWTNPRFEALRVEATAQLDGEKRREMYREMQEIVRDDGGALVIAFPQAVIARTTQLAHGPLGHNAFDGGRIAERWWRA